MNDKALIVSARAVAALGYQDNEKALTELAAKSVTITAITNEDGYKQVHSARMALKNTRIEIQKVGKTAREDATKFSKAVIEEENRLIALIQPEETRLQTLQDAEDNRVETERQAKVDAEIKRVADIQERIEELRGVVPAAAGSPAALILEHIGDIERIVVDATFDEFQQQALDAKDASLGRLRQLHAAAVAHEAEQEQIKRDREELAALKAAQAKVTAEAEARRKEDERQAKAARDAENAAHAETLRRQREESDREAAERKKVIDEQAARQAAEAQRLADQAADIARREAELNAPKAPTPAAPLTRGGATVKVPSADEIVRVLARQYRCTPATILDWLSSMNFSDPRLSEVA